jgi:hypothetical protein
MPITRHMAWRSRTPLATLLIASSLQDATTATSHWNDQSSTRQFRFSGGSIRVVVKIDETVSSHVIGNIVCAVQDEVLAVLKPA